MKREFIKRATGKEKELASIEADGKSFFLLNALADSTTKIVVKFEKTADSTFEVGTIDSKNSVYAKVGDKQCEVAFGDKRYANATEKAVAAGEHEIELSYNTKADDGKLLMIPKRKFSIKNEIALLGISGDDGVDCDEKQVSTKLLSCKIFSGDKLIREYVPVEDESGVKCLLEKVGSFVIYPQAKERS